MAVAYMRISNTSRNLNGDAQSFSGLASLCEAIETLNES